MGGGSSPLRGETAFSAKESRKKAQDRLTEIAEDLFTQTGIDLFIDTLKVVNPPLGWGLSAIQEGYDFLQKYYESKSRGLSNQEAIKRATVQYVSGKIAEKFAENMVDSKIPKHYGLFIKIALRNALGNIAEKMGEMTGEELYRRYKNDR
ncbi:MAG: hypothetical protein ACP6IQ_07470 [Candidatus Njordarchaeia archaeon]